MRRRNSCIYAHEKKYILAKEAGISVNTYSKYLKICDIYGLIRKNEGGHSQFISLTDALHILFSKDELKDDFLKSWKHIRFWKGIKVIPKVREICERIQFAVAEQNYKRQQYIIDKIKKAAIYCRNRFISQQEVKFVKTVARKYFNIDDFETFKSCIRKEKKSLFIKTGKYHVSNLLGCSAATGTRRLKTWTSKNLITRATIFTKLNIPAMAYTPKIKGGYLSISNGEWVVVKGSRLTLR